VGGGGIRSATITRQQPLNPLEQVGVVGAGQYGELGGWERHEIARYTAADEAEQLDDVLGQHEVGIADHQQRRCLQPGQPLSRHGEAGAVEHLHSASRPRDEFRLRVEFSWWGSAGPTRGETVSMSNDDHESWRDCGVRSNGMAAAAGDRIVDLDVSWLVPADLGAVDALARLQIAASRCGWWLQFHGANGGLVELVELVGLGEIMHLCPHCRPA
jgi:hypothetical protein